MTVRGADAEQNRTRNTRNKHECGSGRKKRRTWTAAAASGVLSLRPELQGTSQEFDSETAWGGPEDQDTRLERVQGHGGAGPPRLSHVI